MARLNVLIASRTEHENYILSKKIQTLETEFRGLSFSGVHPAGLVSSLDTMTAVVVLNFNEWTAKEAVHLAELKSTGYRGPILVMAKADVSEAMRAMKETADVVFLEKPFEAKDLIGIIRKMLSARAVAQRIYRRYATSQDALIEIDSQKKTVVSKVHNLSKGGAYLEFASPVPVKVGESLNIRMELKSLNRTYTLPAKVVWTTRPNRAGAGFGVEFTGPGDLKKLILGF